VRTSSSFHNAVRETFGGASVRLPRARGLHEHADVTAHHGYTRGVRQPRTRQHDPPVGQRSPPRGQHLPGAAARDGRPGPPHVRPASPH